MMSDIGQKLKDTLGYGETTPVKTNKDNNLKEDEKQPAELAEVMDDTEEVMVRKLRAPLQEVQRGRST